MAVLLFDDLIANFRRCLEHSWACALLLSAFSIWMTGCDFPGRPDPKHRPVPADQVLDFAILFSQNCAGCHGADGTLGPAPPLNDSLFRSIVPESTLTELLKQGRKNSLMPAFAKENGGSLTEAQIQVLVYEIKGVPYRLISKSEIPASVEIVPEGNGVEPKWGLPKEPPSGVPNYVGRADQAGSVNSNNGNEQAGKAVFDRACSVCHGDDGQGMEMGDTISNTINDPIFLALCSDQVLRRYIITGRPDLRMPGFADARPDSEHFKPLTDEEVSDVVALLPSWRDSTLHDDQRYKRR